MVRKTKQKRTFKKRPMRKARHTRKHQKRDAELVVYRNIKSIPFPSRYKCRFETNVYGYLSSGTNSGYYAAKLNSITFPLNQAPILPNSTPPVTVQQPTGYSSLVNTFLYTKWRVYNSRITVEFLPESLTDTIQAVVVPVSNTGVMTPTTAFAMNQPFAKSGLMSASKDDHNARGGGSEIISSMTQHKLLGVRSQAIEDDLSGQFTGGYMTDPTSLMVWQISWATPDSVNLSANCKYRVRIEHFVELFNPFTGNTLEV